MQYITYDEYNNMGGELSETAFNRNIIRVCGVIDNATYNRVANMSETPEQVKVLCCELVEYFNANQGTCGAVTGRSQSAGPVSESESYAVKSTEEQAAEIDNMICDYLMSVKDKNGTPLLYRGCMA